MSSLRNITRECNPLQCCLGCSIRYTIALYMPFGQNFDCKVLSVSEPDANGVASIKCELLGIGVNEGLNGFETLDDVLAKEAAGEGRRRLAEDDNHEMLQPASQQPHKSFGEAALWRGGLRVPGLANTNGHTDGAAKRGTWLDKHLASLDRSPTADFNGFGPSKHTTSWFCPHTAPC